MRPVAPTVRARIVAMFGPDARRNEIARACDVSGATVTKIAQEEGFEFDRSKTALAVAAAQIDAKATRAAIASKLLLRADEALESMSAPHSYMNWNKDGKFDVQVMDEPTPADKRQYVTIAAIAVQRHADLVKMDATPETQASESVIETVFAGIAAAVRAHEGGTMQDAEGQAEGVTQ